MPVVVVVVVVEVVAVVVVVVEVEEELEVTVMGMMMMTTMTRIPHLPTVRVLPEVDTDDEPTGSLTTPRCSDSWHKSFKIND